MKQVELSIEKKEEKERILYQKKRELADLKHQKLTVKADKFENYQNSFSLKMPTETDYIPLENL